MSELNIAKLIERFNARRFGDYTNQMLWQMEAEKQFPRLIERITELEKKEALFNAAVQMLADWCDAVRDKGTGWDDWDEHYKDASYRDGPLRSYIDAVRMPEDA